MGNFTGGREKTRVFQIMDFSFFVKKRGFAGEGVNPKIRKKGGFTVVGYPHFKQFHNDEMLTYKL